MNAVIAKPAATATTRREAPNPIPALACASEAPQTQRLMDAFENAEQAIAVLSAATRQDQSANGLCEAIIGLKSLATLAQDATSDAIESETVQAMEEASGLYAQALAVCGCINTESVDNQLLYAAESLLSASKSHIDAAIEEAAGGAA